MSYRLSIDDGPMAGHSFAVEPGSHPVGRHGAAIAILHDRYLDDQHAVIDLDETGLHVRDLGSMHGSYVNGHRVTEAPLHDGDIIQFGTTRLRVVGESSAAALRCPGCALGLPATPPAVCPRCGRDLGPLVRGEVAAEPGRNYCVACGKQLPAAARFCPACGHDAEQLARPPAQRSHAPSWMVALLAALMILLLLLLAGGGYAFGRLSRQRPGPGTTNADLPALADPAPAPVADAAPQAPASPELAPAAGQSSPRSDWRNTGRVRLRYGGVPGQRLQYEASTRMDGSMSVLGETTPLDVTASSGYTQDIIANDGGRLTMRLGLQPWGVDQDGKPFGGALPGAPPPLTVTMSPSGEVLGVQQSGAGESVPVPGLPNGLMFDYQAIVQQMSGMSFPDRELAIGDEWERTATVPLPNGGQATFQASSRLDGFTRIAGRDVARVVTRLTTPVTMKLSGSDNQPVENVGELSGTVTSLFDPDEGALVRSDSELSMRFTMSPEGLVPGMGDLSQALSGIQGLYGSLGEEGAAPAMPKLPDPAQTVRLEATGTVRTTVIRTR